MLNLLHHAEAVLARVLANGGDFAEIFAEERSHTSVQFDDGKTERIISGTEVGAGLRLLVGDRTFYGHTNDVTLSGLLTIADTIAVGVSASKAETDFDYHPERLETAIARDPGAIPTHEKVALVREADGIARSRDARVRQVSVTYSDAYQRVLIVNSRGRFVEEVRPQIIFVVDVTAADGDRIQTGYSPIGGRMGFELFEQQPPEMVALEAAQRACLMLEADPAPTGRMPVVLSSTAGGTMIHEAVGHGLEADAIEKGVSKFSGRLGEMIASPTVTVVDDGTLSGRRGSFGVDDEGTPAQRTVLVDQGRLVRYMNDLLYADKLGHAPSGNGRRASYQHRPIPRMTNTLIAPGVDDPDDILSATDRGLFVKRMGGGQVNTLNGDFLFDVTEGYLIEGGKVGRPVRGASLVGNGPEVLRMIERVGTDLGFTLGTCGKDGQGVPVTSAQPTVYIRELTVGGTA